MLSPENKALFSRTMGYHLGAGGVDARTLNRLLDAAREEVRRAFDPIVDELMETMDWVGTGTIKSGEMERREFEQRIAKARGA